MTRRQINKVVSHRAIPHHEHVNQIIETFISWIIVCENFTYKIKRPVQFSFLNFSTMERRKNFCLQEYYLNRRLAGDMYVDVLPVTSGSGIKIGGNGQVVDYAVRMKTMDNSKLMSELLTYKKVTEIQIKDLAVVMANFHRTTSVIYTHANFDLTEKFDDIAQQKEFLSRFMGGGEIDSIQRSIDTFRWLMIKLSPRLIKRVNLGFFRDCHGDLHSGNVFLMKKPIPFDRIEFDLGLREIDVLNEIAFMCMDLEYFDQADFSQLFFETYNLIFPAVLTKEDEHLFLLYKAYRANVCAKVNSLKAQGASNSEQKLNYVNKAKRYLKIMSAYLEGVNRNIVDGCVFSHSFAEMIA
jgi:uncharacterized protein